MNNKRNYYKCWGHSKIAICIWYTLDKWNKGKYDGVIPIIPIHVIIRSSEQEVQRESYSKIELLP